MSCSPPWRRLRRSEATKSLWPLRTSKAGRRRVRRSSTMVSARRCVLFTALISALALVAGLLLGRHTASPQHVVATPTLPPACPVDAAAPTVGDGDAEYWEDQHPQASDARDGVLVIHAVGGWSPDKSEPEPRGSLYARRAIVRNGLQVLQARELWHAGGLVCDAYLVDNLIDYRGEVHAIQWYQPDGTTGCKRRKEVWLGAMPRMVAGMYLLDLDSDGNREIIVSVHSRDWSLRIVDLRLPVDDALVFGEETGLPWLRDGGTWTFADLDGDQRYECVVGAKDVMWAMPEEVTTLAAEAGCEPVYWVYRLTEDGYVVSAVGDEDPVAVLRLGSRHES